uniref:PH domain-containing protein n=1 Tax=Plectus sambesii TaxID=2011161 RepID=A0A914XQ89_9BILA
MSVFAAPLMAQSTSSWTSTVLSAADDEVVNDVLVQKLFRVFLIFSDEQPDRLSRKLRIDTHHAKWLCLLVARCMPKADEDKDAIVCRCEIDARLGDLCAGASVSFRDFLAALGLLFPERAVLEPAVHSLFDRFVNQVLRKGYIMRQRRGCLGAHWDITWCMVLPGRLYFWPVEQTDKFEGRRKEIVLNEQGTAESGAHEYSRYLWHLRPTQSTKTYTFGCLDEHDKERWIYAVNLAIRKNRRADLLQFDRLSCPPLTTSCHQRALTSTTIDSTDRLHAWRLALESDNLRLSDLLNQERQAVKDEEIVRNLATRMLDEERVRRDKLEKLAREQEKQLTLERAVRQQFEEQDANREMELAVLREKLASLTAAEKAARNDAKPIRPGFREREDVLRQLKRDQEALVEYQRDLKEQVLEHQRAQRVYVAETGELLNRLMENSRRRLANSANGSTQLRVVSPSMHSPNQSVSSHSSV